MNHSTKKFRNIHFVGIGGSGMSGLAEVLINLGYTVSGSDISNSAVISRLKKLGAKIYLKHESSNISGSEIIVTSSAISHENKELVKARENSIPILARAEMLSSLMNLNPMSLCSLR